MRAQAAVLKREIEAKLADRVPAALSPLAAQAPRLHPVDNGPLDTLLGGGLPLGSVCELTGLDGSGRSSIALSLLANASDEAACAYIDTSDILSPQSAAAAGIELGNLLWVRFAKPAGSPVSFAKLPAAPKSFGAGIKCLDSARQTGGSQHPRGETKALTPTLEQVLFDQGERRKRKMEGTPGYPNQPLGLGLASQDQIEWEQFNLRKVDETDPLRQLDRQAAEAARHRAASYSPIAAARFHDRKPWDRLDRALRATDQVLQSGGFRIVVLDLASIAPEQALRIPAATWFRYRRIAQESNAILLLLTREPYARSSAACVLDCSIGEPPTIHGVITAAPRMAAIARQRSGPAFGRKAPGRATSWEAAPAWMRATGR